MADSCPSASQTIRCLRAGCLHCCLCSDFKTATHINLRLPLTLASAIDLIIQQTRFKCGSRKITAITEVTGVESGRIQLQDIFVFNREGYTAEGKVKGAFMATGAVPEFLEELREAGVKTPSLELFRVAQTDE